MIRAVPDAPPLRAAKPKRKRSSRRAPKSSADLGIVDQVRTVVRKGSAVASLIGFALGGLVPLVVYRLAHFEISATYRAALWAQFSALLAIICGGLLYSAKTVYQWGEQAFRSKAKAAGFVVLVEGTMVLTSQEWLATTALVYLIGINGIATAVTLSLDTRPRS